MQFLKHEFQDKDIEFLATFERKLLNAQAVTKCHDIRELKNKSYGQI